MCWLPETGAAAVTATSAHATIIADADVALPQLASVRHVVVENERTQHLLVHSTDLAVALVLHGDPITEAPVNLTFHINRLSLAPVAGAILMRLPTVLLASPRRGLVSARRTLMRDALIALDGRRTGASYREMAAVAVGPARAAMAWSSPSRALKDHMVRAHDKGALLAAGGYRRLIG